MATIAHTTLPDLCIGVPLHFREPTIDGQTELPSRFSGFFNGQRINVVLRAGWHEINVLEFENALQVLIIRDWRQREWMLTPWDRDDWHISLPDCHISTEDWTIRAQLS